MRIPVEYVATIYSAKFYKVTIPFRYYVALDVNGIETGIGGQCWGHKTAKAMQHDLASNGEEILDEINPAKRQAIALEVQAAYVARQQEADVEKLSVGDRVKLAVDIGIAKAGRIAKVVQIHTKEDGSDGIVDARWPISVEVLPVIGDPAAWGTGALFLLERGEFVSLDTEL